MSLRLQLETGFNFLSLLAPNHHYCSFEMAHNGLSGVNYGRVSTFECDEKCAASNEAPGHGDR